MHTFGYGSRTDNIKWKDEAYEILLEMVRKDKYLDKDFREYCNDNKNEFDSEAECFKYWADCVYENDTSLISGIEGVVVELINNQYYQDNVFNYEDYCIFVPATIPIDEEDHIPTQKEIREILAKYLNPLIKEPISVGWYDVYC